MAKMAIICKKVLLIMVVCLETSLATSCKDKIIKLKLVKENPVEYNFNTSKNNLFEILTSKFGFLGLSVRTKNDWRIIPPKILDLLSLDGNNQDVFLLSESDHWKSKIFKNQDGDFFDYWVSFYLHLVIIDDAHTKVTVTTIEPRIIIGRELLPSLPHLVRKNKTMLVEPSTIEEYEILLEIGKLVGEKDMPPISLPEKK